jgi:hypothetical protein
MKPSPAALKRKRLLLKTLSAFTAIETDLHVASSHVFVPDLLISF